jgi:GntR family transcriptional regulator
MLIKLNLESEIPIYTQLKNKIIEGIASKELVPGESLPSVRTMAADIGVNMHTVNKAYQQLKLDGFIIIHRQKGVVINPEEMPELSEGYVGNLHELLRPLIAESICRGIGEDHFLQMCKEIFGDIKK